jgi:hypothetical protein
MIWRPKNADDPLIPKALKNNTLAYFKVKTTFICLMLLSLGAALLATAVEQGPEVPGSHLQLIWAFTNHKHSLIGGRYSASAPRHLNGCVVFLSDTLRSAWKWGMETCDED